MREQLQESRTIEHYIDETVSAVVDGTYEVSDLRAFTNELNEKNRVIAKGEPIDDAYLQNSANLIFMHRIASGALRRVRSTRRVDELRIKQAIATYCVKQKQATDSTAV